MLRLIAEGIDLFTGEYPVYQASRGFALCFAFEPSDHKPVLFGFQFETVAHNATPLTQVHNAKPSAHVSSERDVCIAGDLSNI